MSGKGSLNRRRFLQVSGAGMAAAGVLGCTASQPAIAVPGGNNASGDAPPRRIIFMVSDGMSLGVPSMAEQFSLRARGRGTVLAEMLQDPESARGFFETHSLSSLVTDSAAASTSWGSGSRVFNGSLNTLPDGTKMTPIGHLVQQSGRKVGLVTTTRITHATPAGFGSVVPQRDMEDEIAAQYIQHIDVLMGGGLKHFDPATRKDKRDLLAEYAAAGYTIWKTRPELNDAASAPDKVLGLFWGSHVPYTLDWNNTPEIEKNVPTLAEMTKSALASLDSHPEGFLLQVEGGRVDHAAHGNDGAAIMWDQIAFDDAIAVAVNYAREKGDTLVVVTSDHGNSNPGLNGNGTEYNGSTPSFERLLLARASVETMEQQIGALREDGALKAESVREILVAGTGLDITAAEAAIVTAAVTSRPEQELNSQHRNFVGVLGQVVGNHTGLGWTGTSHTQDYTLIAAIGPGSHRFAGLHKNTDGFRLMTELFGIKHVNPSMTIDEAKKHLSSLWRPRMADWA